MIHYHFDKIDSTQDFAKAHAKPFWHELKLWEFLSLSAGEQLQGRGRHGKNWTSPPGNLSLTLVLKLPKKITDYGLFPLVLASATAKLLKELGTTPRIKWPNDVLIGKNKIAGILTEKVEPLPQKGPLLILGIGLNFHLNGVEDPNATCLQDEVANPPSVSQFQDRLIALFEEQLSRYRKEGPSPFTSQIQKGAVTLKAYGELYEGLIQSFDEQGRLELLDQNGKTHCFSSADVVNMRFCS